MSCRYSLQPLGPTFEDDESALLSMGLDVPPTWRNSRTPTIADFRAALSKWDKCDYEESVEDDVVRPKAS